MSVYKVYSGIPFKYRARKNKYWDKIGSGEITEDTAISVVMEAYSGLSATAELSEEGYVALTVASGTLPDWQLFDGISGLLAPQGGYLVNNAILKGLLAEGVEDTGAAQTYHIFYGDGEVVLDTAESRTGMQWIGSVAVPAHEVTLPQKVNFEIVGNVSITDNVASFSNGSALVTNKGLPQSDFFAPNIRFIARVTTGSSVNGVQNIFWDNTANDHGCGIYNGQWRIWNGAVNSGGSVAASSSYWVMLEQLADGGSSLYYIADDSTYTVETLPDKSLWTLATSVSGSLFNNMGGAVRIGNAFVSTNEYWQGTIDLASLHIESGGTGAVSWPVWWSYMS